MYAAGVGWEWLMQRRTRPDPTLGPLGVARRGGWKLVCVQSLDHLRFLSRRGTVIPPTFDSLL